MPPQVGDISFLRYGIDMNKKALVILGPTATGKSDLAVELALRFNGEVISADSRQIYKKLDIGTGKITKEEMKGVPHHLLDITNVENRISVVDWQRVAEWTMQEIFKRGKLPIICGGTGFYIDSIMYDQTFPEVAPNEELRQELENKTHEELIAMIPEEDKGILEKIDKKNKRKLIRIVEIIKSGQKITNLKKEKRADIDFLLIGLKLPPAEAREKINSRLDRRIEAGMIQEVQNLFNEGLSINRLKELGLEYRFLGMHINKELSLDKMKEILRIKIWQYARRQMIWFKRNKNINWFAPTDLEKISELAKNFLK